MKNIFKCVLIIIGTFIGAGFASGQEVASFFNVFLNKGLIGIIISSLLFGIVIFKILRLKNIEKYEDLVKNNKLVLFVMKAFMFVCFCIMISGVGTYAEQEFNLSFWVGAISIAIICFIAFMFKFNGLEKINNILVPIILLGIVLIGINKYDASINLEVTSNMPSLKLMNNWFVSAILYSGYNLIILIPILVELKKYKFNNKEIGIISIITPTLICMMLLLVYRAINLFFPEIMNIELPTLALAKMCGKFVRYYYSIVILLAIFTTAFSTGYAFLKMNSEKNYFRNSILICVFGVILSKIGFSDLINICFPIFGCLGIIQIIAIFFRKNGGN